MGAIGLLTAVAQEAVVLPGVIWSSHWALPAFLRRPLGSVVLGTLFTREGW